MRHLIYCVILSAFTVFIIHSANSKPLHSLSPMAATPTDTEYYYEPVPGKVVGIWPDSFTAQRLALFRERYGTRFKIQGKGAP